MLGEKPKWLTIKPPTGEAYCRVSAILKEKSLRTVCQGAHCPNQSECWSAGTATFLILGDYCTRRCAFCAVKTANPAPAPDPEEPRKLAEAVKELGLRHAVITSVTRDDLPDEGAGHFAAVIRAVREASPQTTIEVLTPDFSCRTELIKVIADAGPDVFGHNLEVVRSLQQKARDPRACYEASLNVLRTAKDFAPSLLTKSSLMLGLGESKAEVMEAMRDLRAAGVDLLTLGQYLQPSPSHLPVVEYVAPEEFAGYRAIALGMGFLHCEAGPLVRSSYGSGEAFLKSRCVRPQGG